MRGKHDAHKYLGASTLHNNNFTSHDPSAHCVLVRRFFRRSTPFFHELRPKSAVTGTDEAALSFRKEGVYEKGYTCALARSSGIYADADIDQ